MTDSMESDQLAENPEPVPDSAKYVILMETNGEECESWLYFLRYDGNEAALDHLQKQLLEVEMYIVEDYSTFDLDLDHFVCPQTAKEMTLVELNSVTFHRKFDGNMTFVDLGLKKKDSNEKRIKRVHDKLGMGKIEDFIEDEDVEEDEECSGSEESDHDSDEDLVPLPIVEAGAAQMRGLAVSEPLSREERAALKKKKKKKN